MKPPSMKVVTDGTVPGTTVSVDGKPLANVTGLRWELAVGDGASRMVADLDWIALEYEGPFVKNISRPTLCEALGMWWRGRRRESRAAPRKDQG